MEQDQVIDSWYLAAFWTDGDPDLLCDRFSVFFLSFVGGRHESECGGRRTRTHAARRCSFSGRPATLIVYGIRMQKKASRLCSWSVTVAKISTAVYPTEGRSGCRRIGRQHPGRRKAPMLVDMRLSLSTSIERDGLDSKCRRASHALLA